MDMLKNYIDLYGEIVFPKDPQIKKIKEEILSMPKKWMVSDDGLHWRDAATADKQKKINWETSFFRKTPKGVTVGVSDEVKKAPGAYQYSINNGYSWIELKDYCPWIFHGQHEFMWFKRKISLNEGKS